MRRANRCAAIRMLPILLAATGCKPAVTATAAPELANPAAIPSGDFERRLTVDGVERTYWLHVPPNLAADSPVPLVLVFHGYRMNGAYMIAMTGFNGLADANGFLTAYPEGTGLTEALSWNAGICCGSAAHDHVDDTAFVRMILEDLKGTAPVDSTRIYATGFSNGALFSYRLACEMSETFAAIAPVAGNMTSLPCQPEQPVSVIHIQGSNDTSAPYTARDVDPDRVGEVFSVVQSIAFWAGIDGCLHSAGVEQEGIVTHTFYLSCAGGTAVGLYTLQGTAHSWPPASLFPASQIIWDFFAAHPKI
jgi:polyhydroxybutyrate depolymerase